jgi:alcohol dehydrogenase
MNLPELPAELTESPIHVMFGCGVLSELGNLAKAHGASRVVVVTDPGIVAAGHADRACRLLEQVGISTVLFDGTRENPTTDVVSSGVDLARSAAVNFVIGIGGGSSMDCAKGINLLTTNGGQMSDYWGVDKNHAPLLPMILIPTTAGTGSEAQSFALISDAVTHRKMACGVRTLPTKGGLRPRVAILDPELTASQPPEVAAATGIDALAHAVESSGSSARTTLSRCFSRQAWALLESAYATAVGDRDNTAARARMLLGAHLAGAAIEASMLGAAHACANPLTASHEVVHGVAVGLLLPHVVRFNTAARNPYSDLSETPADLASRLETLLDAGKIPRRLLDCGIPETALAGLADRAAQEWTAGFNPRPVKASDLLSIYESAYR